MSKADAAFVSASANAIARAGKAHVVPKIRDGVGRGFGSRVLSRNVEIREGRGGPGEHIRRLYIDHYWAVYVHDGRKAIPGPPRGGGKFFVWYKNRKQDPRLASSRGYPRRAFQVAKLSKIQFIRDKKAGKLIFVREIRKSVPASPFFENRAGGGMSGFMASTVRPLMRERWKGHLDRRLRTVRQIYGIVHIILG